MTYDVERVAVKYIIDSNIELSYVENKNEYYIKAGNKYSYISIPFAELVKRLIERKENLEDLVQSEQLRDLLLRSGVIKNIGDSEKRKSHIKLQINIANEKLVNFVSFPFLILFNPKVLLSLAAVGILLLFFFVANLSDVKEYSYFAATPWHLLTFKELSLIYGGMLLSLLLHEVGHTSAAIYHGITPRRVGIGIYFVFPVFFADVTDSWKLDKYSRMKIDIAGVFMQLLVISVCIIYLFFVGSSSVIFYLVTLNIASIIHSLNPMFKFDGYWLASDYFDLSNLRQSSWNQLISFLSFRRDSIDSAQKILLIIYSFFVLGFSLFYLFVFINILSGIDVFYSRIYEKMFSPIHDNYIQELASRIFLVLYSIMYAAITFVIGRIFYSYVVFSLKYVKRKFSI